MFRSFKLRPKNLIIAILLMLFGAAGLYYFSSHDVKLGSTDFTSLGLLASGLISYSGFLVIIGMFENETVLATAILLPSFVAVGIFVYGFIGWSIRVSFSSWKGLRPDYTFVGLKQYTDLFNNDPRFMIDVRNTAVFTVGFILSCLIIGFGLAIYPDRNIPKNF